MDAVKYFKEKGRMSDFCSMVCEDCPLNFKNNKKRLLCTEFESKSPEEAIAIVEQWVKEHPVKTRQDEFLELFPNADIDKEGVLTVIPCHIDKGIKKIYCQALNGCIECRKAYWLSEVE